MFDNLILPMQNLLTIFVTDLRATTTEHSDSRDFLSFTRSER
jgi:hypothetical protein